MFKSHQAVFDADTPAFENFAGLERLPEERFVMIALSMKIAGGSRGPLRIAVITL